MVDACASAGGPRPGASVELHPEASLPLKDLSYVEAIGQVRFSPAGEIEKITQNCEESAPLAYAPTGIAELLAKHAYRIKFLETIKGSKCPDFRNRWEDLRQV